MFRIELEEPVMGMAEGSSATGWEKVKLFIDLIERKALDLLRQSLPEWEVVEAELKRAYDTYVRPIDIPYVPNVVEGKVDDWLRDNLIEAVKKAYDSLVAA